MVSWDAYMNKDAGRMRLKRDGTRAETRFSLLAKRTSPFSSAVASVQSTTDSRGVGISGSNAGYTMFRGSVKVYWLPTPFANFPFTSPTSASPCAITFQLEFYLFYSIYEYACENTVENRKNTSHSNCDQYSCGLTCRQHTQNDVRVQ